MPTVPRTEAPKNKNRGYRIRASRGTAGFGKPRVSTRGEDGVTFIAQQSAVPPAPRTDPPLTATAATAVRPAWSRSERRRRWRTRRLLPRLAFGQCGGQRPGEAVARRRGVHGLNVRASPASALPRGSHHGRLPPPASRRPGLRRAARRLDAASSGVVLASPARNAASVSLGVSTDTSASSSSGTAWAGAGLRMVVLPAPRASRRAVKDEFQRALQLTHHDVGLADGVGGQFHQARRSGRRSRRARPRCSSRRTSRPP